jgi:2'-deoxynucleoside 5'-phosphate N-hydrolase
MKFFLSIKFHSDASNEELIKKIIEKTKDASHEMVSVFTDYEDNGKIKFSPKELMQITFEAINSCDALLVEFSEKGVGLGIEAGYAFSRNKPVYVIAKKGSEISETLRGIAKEIFFYNSINDLELFFNKISI